MTTTTNKLRAGEPNQPARSSEAGVQSRPSRGRQKSKHTDGGRDRCAGRPTRSMSCDRRKGFDNLSRGRTSSGPLVAGAGDDSGSNSNAECGGDTRNPQAVPGKEGKIVDEGPGCLGAVANPPPICNKSIQRNGSGGGNSNKNTLAVASVGVSSCRSSVNTTFYHVDRCTCELCRRERSTRVPGPPARPTFKFVGSEPRLVSATLQAHQFRRHAGRRAARGGTRATWRLLWSSQHLRYAETRTRLCSMDLCTPSFPCFHLSSDGAITQQTLVGDGI